MKVEVEVVVTRHPGLVAYLKKVGLASDNTQVVAHASPEVVQGKHVCGVLPHNLSCLCSSFTEVPLHLPAELRGQELSLEQVEQYAQPAVTYKVEKL
jgi:putative CRISPR-associated protein (TIGR02620 family)